MLLALFACTGPLSGNYTFVVDAEESDCPESYAPATDPEGTQTIFVERDAIVLAGDPEERCERDEARFECDFAGEDERIDFSEDGFEAWYVVDAQMSGEWIDVDVIEGETSVETTCDGEDCERLARSGAPACLMTWFWTAERG